MKTKLGTCECITFSLHVNSKVDVLDYIGRTADKVSTNDGMFSLSDSVTLKSH